MENNSSIVIALGGEPASGKTTLLKRIRKNFPPLIDFKEGLVRGGYCPISKVYFVFKYPRSIPWSCRCLKFFFFIDFFFVNQSTRKEK